MAYRIPKHVVDQVREQTNIIDVISHYVNLTKRGKNYVGLCPFHDENTPSFTVEPEKQFFKCFSCGRGGNVFSFVMEMEGIGFKEAVQKVVSLGNLTIDFDFDSLEDKQQYRTEDMRLIALHREVADFYHYVLTTTKVGEPALAYLKQRGLSDETIETFHIGLAPATREMTYRYLVSKGYTEEELATSGIFLDDSPKFDRFENRIVFPLRNEYGDPVAFSGRIWQDDQTQRAKYLNSPETSIFKKNRFLFNLDQAKKRSKKGLLLFEGFMDVISAYSAGVTNGVASLGTSLTDNQIHIMSKRIQKVTIAYDGDQPGFKATKRAVEHFQQLSSHLELQVVLFPEGLDPDEFVQRHGSDRFQQFLSEQRLSPMQFYRVYYQQLYSLNDDEDKVHYIQEMLTKIAENASELVESIQIQTLSEDTGVSTDVLTSQLAQSKQRVRQSHAKTVSNSSDNSIVTPTEGIEENLTVNERSGMQLLNRLIYHPEVWQYIEGSTSSIDFSVPELETIYLLLADRLADQSVDVIDTSNFYSALRSDKARQYFLQIMKLELPPRWTNREIDDLLRRLTVQPDLEKQNNRLTDQIDQARKIKDFAEIQSLNRQRIDNLRRLKNNR
ncbi:MAG: DNA primase [Aerococcus sp.]|nr:DNA primase [Aerococcus sp.]